MDKNNLFSIGEMAKKCGTSIRSLRHYDEIGLLKPCYIDPNTNYRYYSNFEIYWGIVIKEFKDYNFSLSQLKNFFYSKSINSAIGIYNESNIQVMNEIKKYEKIKKS